MRNSIIILLLLTATSALAEVNVNINLNSSAPYKATPTRPLPSDVPVVAVPIPVPVQASAPPRFVIQEAPDFLEPSALGFYVAIGVPYDLYYSGNSYYIYHDKVWFMANSYNGPWDFVNYGQLPPNLHKYRDNVEHIRVVRDQEFGEYKRDRTHYKGRHFKPGKELKEKRKGDREELKKQKKDEHEDWQEEKRHDREEKKRKKQKRYGDDD